MFNTVSILHNKPKVLLLFNVKMISYYESDLTIVLCRKVVPTMFPTKKMFVYICLHICLFTAFHSIL
jgi:hypothetical protein